MASSSGSGCIVGNPTEYWRRNLEASSRIPYREGPLEYAPSVLCKCDAKAARFISWSDLNPRIRYLKCARARDGGCDFFQWVDDPIIGFTKQLLLDLRDAVRYWRCEALVAERGLEDARTEAARVSDGAARENQRLKSQLEALVKFNEDRQAMFVAARRDVAIMQGEVHMGAESRAQLEARIGKLQKDRRVLLVAVFVLVGLLVALLVASKPMWYMFLA